MHIRRSMIAAIGKNRELGKAGSEKLLWHIPEDFAYFKEKTFGKPVIMGASTYMSMGRLLPGRPNIILSKKALDIPGAVVVHSLPRAYEIAEQKAVELKVDEFFNIGGASVYAQCLERTERLYLTVIDAAFPEATVFFPEYVHIFSKTIQTKESKNDMYTYSFLLSEK